MKKHLLIITFIVLTVFLRFYKLDSVPAGFHNDEASFLINAIAIKDTGRDEDGRLLPIFLNSTTDPKPALYSYLQVPFIAVFGESIWSARLLGSILGLLSLYLINKLLRELDYPNRLSFGATALVAISPWHVFISRSTHEVILSLVFTLMLLIVILRAIKKKGQNPATLLGILILSLLAGYTYHTAKVLVPLLVGSLLVIFYKPAEIGRSALIFIATVIPIIFLLLLPVSWARFSAVSLFKEEGPYAILTNQIATGTDRAHPILLRALHNKIVNYGLAIFENYSNYFTADFLIFNGGEPTRYKIPAQGLLHHPEIILLLAGVVITLVNKAKNNGVLLFTWLLLPPLVAAVTFQEVPSTIRTAFMMIPVYVLVARGLLMLWDNGNTIIKLMLRTSLIAIYIFSLTYFWHQYSVMLTYQQPWHRNVADAKLANFLIDHQDLYSKITITTSAGVPYLHIFLKEMIPLQSLQESYPARTLDKYGWGKYLFNSDTCPFGLDPKSLYIVRFDCHMLNNHPHKVVGKISYDDGNHGYVAVEWLNEPKP